MYSFPVVRERVEKLEIILNGEKNIDGGDGSGDGMPAKPGYLKKPCKYLIFVDTVPIQC